MREKTTHYPMGKIAKDIIYSGPITKKDCKRIMNNFYAIMRKYNIKQGISGDGGKSIQQSNYEWTMCQELFLRQIIGELIIYNITHEVPKDLQWKEER